MTTTRDRETSEHLLAYITGARWFAGKGRLASLRGLTTLPWLTGVSEWPAVRFEVAEIGYPPAENANDDAEHKAGPGELYQLAVSYRSAPKPGLQHAEIGRFTDPDLGPVVAYDATQDPAACRTILVRLLAGRRYTDGERRVGFHLVSGGDLSTDLVPQVFTGQQSNTSVMYGDVAMLKLFRRLELGHNLDIEVHASLSSHSGDLARLYGWVDATWQQSTPAGLETVSSDLAMVVEKLRDAEDGWGLALDSLRAETGFADSARELGRALADTHRALRAAFPTAAASGASVAQTMKERLARAAEVAPALRPLVDGLNRCFDALSAGDLATQRVHGDFHLGQTLRTPSGWKIIDFEGEPVKSLAERAEPDSVWRDIAGMLRSFDYAAASVPGPASQGWLTACRTAFLEGYAEPGLDATEAALLRAYVADKAVYEVVYEVRNRPDWVSIPLAAVAALSTTPAPGDDSENSRALNSQALNYKQ